MTELKQKLIDQINNLDDEEILIQISSAISDLNSGQIIEFNSNQTKRINESIKQIESGNFVSNEEVMNKLLNE
jgi:predicted transcriptional regulator